MPIIAVLVMLMGSEKLQAQVDTCLDAIEVHNVNLYRIGCEKCKLDLVTAQNALKDSENRTVSQDHSATVVIGVVAFLFGALIGSSMKN